MVAGKPVHLPFSVQAVYQAISNLKRCTPIGLARAIGMSSRTVRFALDYLNQRELVLRTPNLRDMRSCFYSIKPQESTVSP